MRKTTLTIGVALALSVSAAAQAITFKTPEGTVTDVQTFDWTVGNAIALGAADTIVGDTFTLLAHGSLGNFLDSNGDEITANNGLNSAYEITFVLGFDEVVVSQGTGFQQFADAATHTVNFFEIWYDSSNNSDMLAGTGFNDGQLIASGVVTDSFGNFGIAFELDENNQPVFDIDNLDQFGGDNYADIDSVEGTGGTKLDVTVETTFYDLAFFPGGVGPMFLDFNTQNNLPFNETNPSALFTGAAGGGTPTQDGATVASVGNVNGGGAALNDGVERLNVMFMADASSGVELAQIPEPNTIALFGLALTGLGFVSARRRNRQV
jgi:hypothetical protein